tara:strand:+ start:14760 stop:15128 length:369 start_codon:yes stop_codon:yes gene_type:complete
MIDYKFNEDMHIAALKDHIDNTYNSHYSKEKFQATEFIIDAGHGDGFCIGNILKYAQRYGKKGTHADARKDLMKILHYAVIQMDIHDKKIKSDEVSFGPTISLDTNPIDQIQINSQDTDLYR